MFIAICKQTEISKLQLIMSCTFGWFWHHTLYYGAVLPRRRPHYVSRLSVCLSVPCLHLEGKRKGLGRPNLVGRVPGTRAPRGPISRYPAVAGVGRPYPKASVPPPRGKTKRPTYTKLGRKGPWDTSTPWTNFKNPSCCWGGPTVPESQRAST